MTTPLRILLVEDHLDTRTVLGGYLRHLGHDVTEVTSVEEAAAELSASPRDLLITDLGLPDGFGWQLVEMHRNRATYIVAISGFGSADDLARSAALGMHEHLVKPLDPDRIDAMLERAAEATAS